jgi:hypothetical protein
MAGYLDQYGAGEERREKIVKIIVVSVLAIIVLGGIAFLVFKNYRQERQVKRFFQFLERHEYQQAYMLWGCTDSKPCRDYPFSEFMKDWVPSSSRAEVDPYRIAKSRACGSGVIVTADFGKSQQEKKLWVQRDDLVIGFSPWPGCPPGR